MTIVVFITYTELLLKKVKKKILLKNGIYNALIYIYIYIYIYIQSDQN